MQQAKKAQLRCSKNRRLTQDQITYKEKNRQMRISTYTILRLMTVAFVLVLASVANAYAQGSLATKTGLPALHPTVQEQVKKMKGVVIKREPDSFTMSETTGGPSTTVLLTADTEVKSHKKGAFRGSKEYAASYILRGLRLEVDGTRQGDGSIVASKVRFDEQDLRTAQALKATLDPAEAELNAKLKQQQEEQERLAGQIQETQALAQSAKEDAAKAQEAANKAQSTADYANNRINGLDDFDPIKTITVYFKTGSAVLGPQAKKEIDNAAVWVKTQNTKGWVMAVIGYADTTGNSQRNIDLSERRANAVIYYIVSKYKMPLNRLVQPFGYGQLEPAAENATKAGRAKNRRVEIRLMINKGIAGTVGN